MSKWYFMNEFKNISLHINRDPLPLPRCKPFLAKALPHSI